MAPAPRAAGGTFVGDGHWTSLDAIAANILNGTSLIVVTGETGSGKSRLVDAAIARLAQEPICFVRLASAPLQALTQACLANVLSFQEIVECLPIGRIGQGPGAARRGVKAPVRVCLVIDDADTLGPEGVRFLLQLLDATTGEATAPTVIFVGRPEFRAVHDQSALPGLRKRTLAHLQLSPLSDDGVGQYAEHLLQRAGTSVQHVMSKASAQALVRLSQGNPRRINSLMATGLELAAEAGRRIRTQDMTQAAARLDARGETPAIAAYPISAVPRLKFEQTPSLAPQPARISAPSGRA